MSKREPEFYPWLCEQIKSKLHFQDNNALIAFSEDRFLPEMIKEIEQALDGETLFHGEFIPKLKLDILIGIKFPGHRHISLVLFEIKYLSQLTLLNYSQLIGYLLVAQRIKLGVLLNVIKGTPASSTFSEDFADIVVNHSLPMDVSIHNNSLHDDYGFKTGICSCIPNSRIIWEDLHDMNGISNWQQLVELCEIHSSRN